VRILGLDLPTCTVLITVILFLVCILFVNRGL
jgi:hypothetical protein